MRRLGRDRRRRKPAASRGMNCQKCGRQLFETEKFCIGCGTPAAAATHPEPLATQPEPASPVEVRCDSCGEELTTDDRFCQSCGAQIGGPTVTEGPVSRLTEPVEAQFEGVDAPGVHPVGSPASISPPPGKHSNSTLYQLLGLVFGLIACSYFAYDYFSTPGSPRVASVPGEEVELAQKGTASAPNSESVELQIQRETDERVPSVTRAPAATPVNSLRSNSPVLTPRRPTGSNPPPASPEAAQQTSPDTSQEEAAGRLSLPSSPPVVAPHATTPPPKVSSGEVLMPGVKAWKRTDTPPRGNTAPVQPPPAQKGTIYWTGKLRKNQVIVIENGEASAGIADGDHFTGIPIDVHLPSPAVRLVERPTGENNWSRVAFRCLRNTKQSVTINIQWNLLR